MNDRNNPAILPVIMSGGSGTRLWPLSTPEQPKQFHALATTNTMIQETALRLSGDSFLPPVAICGRSHLDLVTAQLAQIGRPPQAVVLEPMARNTAAVAALAALTAADLAPGALVLMVPADHVITDPEAFQRAIALARVVAHERIVTFGICPAHAETGFGYIERGEALADGVFSITRFLEKPDLATAEAYLAGGRHDWNAGIFLFSPDVMLRELERFAPTVLAACRSAYGSARRHGVVVELDGEAFATAPSVSVDVAIMEKTSASAVVPCAIGWADVGGFAELWRLGAKDEGQNHVRGDAVLIDAANCLVHNTGASVVAVIGLDHIMVISTPSGILVAPIARAQEVRKAAEAALKLTKP